MPIPNASYPFDATGIAPSNRVVGERQIIPVTNVRGFRVLVPFAAPYFRSSLRISQVSNGRELQEGVDYYCTHRFHDATGKIGQPIYGSITMLDKTLNDTLDLRYQTVGGEWTLNESEIYRILAESLLDPRTATWEQVVDIPHSFPPVNHPHDINAEMGNFVDVIAATHRIADAIQEAGQGASEAHIYNKENPHETTAAQVGLPLVPNFGMATVQEMVDGARADRFSSPAAVRAAVQAWVGAAHAQHLANEANPHKTTAFQVGLGNVENYAMATLQEAINGAAQNRYLSPYLATALLDARLDSTLGEHIQRQDNPHNVTKQQLGLGDVPNFPKATAQQALTGVADTAVMTPYLTKLFADSYVGDTIYGHIADQDNPHNVTKAQVGLANVPNLGLATLQAAQAGTSDSGLMTPRLVAAAIGALGGGGTGGTGGPELAAHVSNQDNPHGVTAAQVGTYDADTIDLRLGNKVTRGETVTNTERLSGLTSADIISQAKSLHVFEAVDAVGPVAGTPTYTTLGHYVPAEGVDTAAQPPADLVFYVAGGEARRAFDAPLHLVRVQLYPNVKMEVERVQGAGAGIAFGYEADEVTGAVTIYSHNPANRNSMSVMVLSDAANAMGVTQPPMTATPLDWTDAEVVSDADAGSSPDAVAGELVFGRNPHIAFELEPDTVVQHINVVSAPDDLDAAPGIETELSEDYQDWIPQSAYGKRNWEASLSDLLGWSWGNGIRFNDAGESLVSIRTPEMYENYTFEVDITSPSEDDGFAGVVVASVRRHGKDYNLYALRCPRTPTLGTYPQDGFHKRLTVGLNLCQSDALDLGSVVGNYASATNWAAMDSCRIRVRRVGDIITISTADIDGGAYSNGTEVVVDLSSRPELAIFRGPTAWGVAKVGVTEVRFNVLNRPDRYAPYIHHNLTEGVDLSEIYRYNGEAWVSQPTRVDSYFSKPGRIVYSKMTGVLYGTRRNGALYMMPTIAFARDGVTVLTP